MDTLNECQGERNYGCLLLLGTVIAQAVNAVKSQYSTCGEASYNKSTSEVLHQQLPEPDITLSLQVATTNVVVLVTITIASIVVVGFAVALYGLRQNLDI